MRSCGPLLGLPACSYCVCGAGHEHQKVTRGQDCVLAGGHPNPPVSSNNRECSMWIRAPNVLLQFLPPNMFLFLPQAPACTARKTPRETTVSSARSASTGAPTLCTPATAARAPPWHPPAPAESVRLSFWSDSSDNECCSLQLNWWFVAHESPHCGNQDTLLEAAPLVIHPWCLCCLL